MGSTTTVLTTTAIESWPTGTWPSPAETRRPKKRDLAWGALPSCHSIGISSASCMGYRKLAWKRMPQPQTARPMCWKQPPFAEVPRKKTSTDSLQNQQGKSKTYSLQKMEDSFVRGRQSTHCSSCYLRFSLVYFWPQKKVRRHLHIYIYMYIYIY